MKLPTGGWPFVVIVALALAVVLLTYAFLGRTTYDPNRDDMAPPTRQETHQQLERREDGSGPRGAGRYSPGPVVYFL